MEAPGAAGRADIQGPPRPGHDGRDRDRQERQLHRATSHDDFEIVEDGSKQTVRYFARGDEATAAPPLHVGRCSIRAAAWAKTSVSRSAAAQFLNTLSDAVDMTLVDFDTEVRVAVQSERLCPHGRADPQRGTERVDGATMRSVYLDGAADNEGRTILVIYTDGGDTRSSIAFSDVHDARTRSDVTIHAVGFLEHQPSRLAVDAAARLRRSPKRPAGRHSSRRR